MKRKLLNILMALVLLATIPGTMALASDITDALYYMTIVVSNNNTAENYVATNGTNISTPNLIAGDFLSSSANECAFLDAAGSDVPFMPGYSTNPWCFWISAIPAYSYLNYYLYTANSTGGLIAYFPDTTGMLVSDNATLELAADGEIEIDGWVDTVAEENSALAMKRDATAIKYTDDNEISGIVYFDEPIDVSPDTTGAWVDIDVTDYVPEYATGVVVHLQCNAVIEIIGVRMNGVALDSRGLIYRHLWGMVGIDSDDIFEGYIQSANDYIYIIGFTGSGVTYKTVPDDISLGVALAWTDIDLSVEAPDAIGVIVAIDNTAAGVDDPYGLQKKGSADNITGDIRRDGWYYGIVGCDASQLIQGYIGAVTTDFYLVGYITGDFTFETNGIDKSFVAGFGAWNDIDCSGDVPEGTTHIIFEVKTVAAPTYGLRRNGSTENITEQGTGLYWAVVECDEDRIVEGYASNNQVDWWIIGYTSGYIDSPYQGDVIATNLSPDEYVVNHSLNANSYDFSDYDTYTTVAVIMGNGMMPVVLLDEEELAAPAALVTFSGIDTLVSDWDTIAGVTSRHLVLVTNIASDVAITNRQLYFTMNGLTGGGLYNYQFLSGEAAVATASRQTGQNVGILSNFNGTSYANSFSGGVALFPHAFNTTNHKAWVSMGGAVEQMIEIYAGRVASAQAIASLALTPTSGNFATGSTFWLGVVDERYLVEEDLLAAPGTIDINNIPQDGSDFVAIGYLRGTNAAIEDELVLELNADGVVANYNTQRLLGTTAVTSAASANDNLVGWTTGDNATANVFSAFVGFINQYSEGTNDPSYLTLNGYHETSGPTSRVGVYSGRRNNVATITRCELYGSGAANLATGSLCSLYVCPKYLIYRQELTAPAATITFNNIPQGYEALQVNVYTRSSVAALIDSIDFSLNTDVVAANYDQQLLYGAAAAVGAVRGAATRAWMAVVGNTAGANIFSGGIITFPNYAKNDRHKHSITIDGRAEALVSLKSNRWENTNPITRIDLTITSGNNFMAGTIAELVGIFPQDVHAIEIDGDLYGISDGNNLSVPDTNTDWYFGINDAMPYINSANVTASGVPVSAWAWEYGAIFYDSIGANDATPSFRAASSDADVEATAVSFQPVEEAKAPSYTMDTTTATWLTASNVTGNFTTTPTPTYPGHAVIEAVSTATGTPAQLPFTVLFGFITLAVSLSISAILRNYGSRSLFVKTLIIGVMMGIGEALRVVDFWMLIFFVVIALAIMVASKQGDVV